MVDREERFELMFEVVASVLGEGAITVLDLGCGPGSLGSRLVRRFPEATVIGVDLDPVLLELAGGAWREDPRLRWVNADLGSGGWIGQVPYSGGFDAALSTTALHWLTLDQLTRLYADLARLLRPGGVFLDGDHCRFPGAPRLEAAAQRVHEMVRGRRTRPVVEGETWGDWWDAIRAEPQLADAVAERDRIGHAHRDRAQVDDAEHCRRLRAAGFSEAATLWQQGDERILAAVR
jgi:SAM-dependent methyltransferase